MESSHSQPGIAMGAAVHDRRLRAGIQSADEHASTGTRR